MPKPKKKKRIKGIKNRHMPVTIYAPSSLSKKEKEAIKEIRKLKEYPKEIKLNPKWDEYFTGREKKKVLKYIAKTGNLQYNIFDLLQICRGIKK